ncbi:MAG: TIGR04283 family arsenosugar biosynthesis glycosyltransferase [Desulfomonilaceae bacterium]
MRSISVIIPTLNEAEYLPLTLRTLSRVEFIEIIVADGGSIDETCSIARSFSAKVLNCPRGRSHQMNEASRVAAGGILLFLHADTILPENWDLKIRTVLEDEDVCGGAFSLRIEGDSPGFRVVEALANIRSRLFHMPYGDQAIFVRSNTFRDIGGFPDLTIMEDFEFVRQLRRRFKMRILPDTVITSGRRWRELGILRTTVINQAMIIGYFAGVRPEKLARIYRNGTRLGRYP